jgi:DNA-directed RNA polymerase subunit M/transcription elongation factor TFIIS
MICTKCGALMDQTDKDSSSGRVIREYLCRNCGYTDWEDDGVALWKVLHDAREEDEAERAAQAATTAAPEPASPFPNSRTSLLQRLTRLFRSEK